LARRNVELQKGSLQLAEARLRGGEVSGLDTEQATTNLEQTEALVPVLERGLRGARNRLCILLGVPPRRLEQWLTGPPSVPAAPTEVVVGIPAELLRRRPDVRRAEREVAAQSARIGIAVADLYPQFRLSGSINIAAEDFSDLFSSASNAGFISPGFRWRILNYGRILNNIRVQDARFQQLAVIYQDTVLRANLEVENAIVGFLRSLEEVQHRAAAVEAAQQSVKIAQTRYGEGEIDFGRVFVLDQTQVLVQDDLARTQAAVASSLIDIYRALGGGWQMRYTQPYVGRAPDPFVRHEEMVPSTAFEDLGERLPEPPVLDAVDGIDRP